MRKFVCLAVLVLLSGCEKPKKDVAHLTFNKEAYSPRTLEEGERQLAYSSVRDMISTLLQEGGVDPETVAVEADPDDRNAVILSAPSGVAESEGFDNFYKRLNEITEARETLPVTLTLKLDLEAIDSENPDVSSKVENFQEEIKVDFIPSGIQLSHFTHPVASLLGAAVRGEDTLRSQAYCSVVAEIEPNFPFRILNIKEVESDAGLEKEYYVEWDAVKIDAQLSFDHPALQGMLDTDETVVTQPTLGSRKFNDSLKARKLVAVELPLGAVGSVRLDSTHHADYIDHSSVRRRCEEEAVDLGRPFTFYLGNTIDRLVSFRIIEHEE